MPPVWSSQQDAALVAVSAVPDRARGAAASTAILLEGDRVAPIYTGVAEALAEADTMLRLFGKPEIVGRRRMGVALALAETIEEARAKSRRSAAQVRVQV